MRLPDLDLKDLALVAAIDDTKRLTGAARQLGLSVSAVSHRLKALEDHLGTVLFTRGASGMTATSAGRRFAAEALLALEAAYRAVAPAPDPEKLARVGSAWLMATTLLPPLIERSRPGSEWRWHIRTGRSQDVLDWVEGGAVDVGLVRLSRTRPGVNIRIVGADPVELMVPRRHRWVTCPPDQADLAREPFVRLSEHSGFGRFLREASEALGIRTGEAAEVDNLEAALALVAAGVGPAFLPRSLVRLRRPDAVREVRLSQLRFPRRPLALAWRGGNDLPAWAEAWPLFIARLTRDPSDGLDDA